MRAKTIEPLCNVLSDKEKTILAHFVNKFNQGAQPFAYHYSLPQFKVSTIKNVLKKGLKQAESFAEMTNAFFLITKFEQTFSK